MSRRVPIKISNTIKITKDCIYIGDTVSAKIANGFTDNITILSLSLKVFSIDDKIDQL
tara:strand:- start:501 stop:674 length:174 start_codon:yes stop_codon:yes gene_type:complete